MNTRELLELLDAHSIRTALIVDDAYDLVPKAGDIAEPTKVWATFSDDLSPEQKKRIDEADPATAGLEFNVRIEKDDYVAAVWNLREELGDVSDALFKDYIRDQKRDAEYLEKLKVRLEALGLAVVTAGRNFKQQALTADIIIIDLYLGQKQDETDFAFSKDSLQSALKERAQAQADRPPLVILMSRSPLVSDKRDEFRDKVGLMDSAFRILSKQDLEAGVALELQLERLANSFADTRLLAGFFKALEGGLNEAVNRTLSLLRKLKLSDINQIKELLLDVEGQPTGSYLVDVFDLVLQHEIESDEDIIEAAKALDGFSASSHSPYVSVSPDLQELVARLRSQNEKRLKLRGSAGPVVMFGDLLRLPPEDRAARKKLLPDLTPDQILLVLTPACDLQHGKAPRIILLVGKVCELAAKSWTYDSARTPAIHLDGGLRWIKWELKHVATERHEKIKELLESSDLILAGRLRESHALALQQMVLAGIGRIGQVTQLPATFPAELEAYYAGVDGNLQLLEVREFQDGAVYWVGRDDKGNKLTHLTTTEMAVDGLVKALNNIHEDQISTSAREAFKRLKETSYLEQKFAAGLELKDTDKDEPKLLPLTEDDARLKVGLIYNNLPANGQTPKVLRQAGIVLRIKLHNESNPAGLESTGLEVTDLEATGEIDLSGRAIQSP